MIDPEKEVSGVIYNGIRLTLAGSGESAPFIVKLTESEGVYSVDKSNQEIYDAMLANTRILITDDLFIMPLIFCQEAEAIFACTADFVDGPENVTVIVRTESGEQTVTILNEPLSMLEDAPVDGKQYARKDGAWAEVQGGGQGWTTEQIDMLEDVFEKLVYTDAEGGAIAAQLINSLRGGVVPEEPITIAFDGTTAVISGLASTNINHSGTTAEIGG